MKFVLHIRFGPDEIEIASDDATELSTIAKALETEDGWHTVQDRRAGRNYRINCRNVSYIEIRETGATLAPTFA